MPSYRSALLALVCLAALAVPARAQAETPEDRYSFLVGLCDEREWQLAAREARGFLEEFPRHPKAELARYRLATALFELGERSAARDAYAQLAARQNFEFRAEALFRLGQCELLLGRPAEAAVAFERVNAIAGSYLAPAALFFLGEARFAAGDFAAAEECYARVNSSEYAREAHYGLCWCAFRLGRHDQALERIARYLERYAQHPSAMELRYLAGEAQLAAGRAPEALASFSSVRDGEFAERALRGAAFAAAAAGDHRGAAERFGRLVERAPQGEFAAEAALQRGIQLLLAGDPRAAVAALAGRAIDSESGYWLGKAQLASGDAASALASAEAACASQPHGELAERLAVLRGDALTELGRLDDAARAYASARGDYALHAAAIAAFNAGRLEEAASAARGVLERFPGSVYGPEMHLVCGEAALAAKDYASAARSFRSAAVEPASPGTRARADLRAAWCELLGGDARQALALAQRAIREHGDSADAHEARFVLGRAAEKLGDQAAAAEAWRAYIELAPTGQHAAEALAGLARVDAAGAALWSARLVEEHPQAPAIVGALLELAERDAREGRSEQAVQRYREVLSRWPEHERALAARYGLAWCLYDSGQYEAAARELAPLCEAQLADAALARSASELAVWASSRAGDSAGTIVAYRRFAQLGAEPRTLLGAARLAGAALAESGRPQEARAVFDELLGLARGERAVQAEVLLESAWIALEAKDADEAEAALRTAWKLGPEESARAPLAEATFFAAEQRFEAQDAARAQALYELALPYAAPEIAAQALYKLGFVHLRAEHLDEAAAAFARVAADHPTHELAGESRYLLGECRFRQGRYEEAVSALAPLLREQPRHACAPKALFRLAVAQGELGRWKECEAALAELARREPQGVNALEADLWRGRALAARGEARNARAAFERVAASDRGLLGARARLELGGLDEAAGRHEEALAQYLKVALLYEGGELVAEASFRAGGALEALARPDKARARYAELAEKHPDSPFAARARERLAALGR